MTDLADLIARVEGATAAKNPDFRAAWDSYVHAVNNPVMVECSPCDGRGYHHGFGDDGNDPDWCMTCGGGGVVSADGEDERPLREGILALLRSLQAGAQN